jgi:hypothetical protein
MARQAKIIGVHPFEADEPVHLIEMLVAGDVDDFDIGEVTQEVVGQERLNWQAPYDERLHAASEGQARYVFFFHFLDLDRPLLSSFGALSLPTPTPTPTHLKNIMYEPP